MATKIQNLFKTKSIPKSKLGNAGYDNTRENIDPHLKTKVVSTKEITLSDGSAAGFVKNTANGVLSGGNAGGAGAVEGVDVLSTGEIGASKYLREDGDNTCSWQTPTGAGDVTAAANLTNNTIVQGDGGAKGVKTSTATVAQIATNVTHVAGNGSDHADVASNTTHRGVTTGNPHAVKISELANPDADTDITMANRHFHLNFTAPTGAHGAFELEATGGFEGDLLHMHQLTGNPAAVDMIHIIAADTDVTFLRLENSGGDVFVVDHSGNITLSGTVDGIDVATDVAANTSHRALTNNPHSTTKTHVGLSVVPNTNFTTPVGSNTTHRGSAGTADHSQVSTNKTHVDGNGADHADVASNTTHRGDNTQAHSDYLLNNASDSTSGTITAGGLTTTGVTLTGDHGTAATDQVVNVCYGTGSAPTANTTTIGTLFVKYTA